MVHTKITVDFEHARQGMVQVPMPERNDMSILDAAIAYAVAVFGAATRLTPTIGDVELTFGPTGEFRWATIEMRAQE